MTIPKIDARNMVSAYGRPVANQIITYVAGSGTMFTSYGLNVAFRPEQWDGPGSPKLYLDPGWQSTATSNKYRCRFLNENGAETKKKLKTGEYALAELN